MKEIERSVGTTSSEQYLAKLCDATFLRLWSYPNLYIDKLSSGKGSGNELCDISIIFGNHIILFSDKDVSWPNGDTSVAWRRWYKRAIKKSVDQLEGAERWIRVHPERIYLDKECRNKLPLDISRIQNLKIHKIAVAIGAAEECAKHFGDQPGTFLIDTRIRGDAHFFGDNVQPFCIGNVGHGNSFVHVMDEFTVDVSLGLLDTAPDFIDYLEKREAIWERNQDILANSESDIIMYYMTHMNNRDEHDICKPDGTQITEDTILFDEPIFFDTISKPQFQEKLHLDKESYMWDKLIGIFLHSIMSGDIIFSMNREINRDEEMEYIEMSVRYMAATSRYHRRHLGRGVLEVLHTGRHIRFARAFIEHTGKGRDTGFLFMTLPYPDSPLPGGYEQYRKARQSMLQTYAFSYMERYRFLKRMICIGVQPPSENIESVGSSEDLLFVEAPRWTSEFIRDLRRHQKHYEIFRKGRVTEKRYTDPEFPERLASGAKGKAIGNRKQRRAEKARHRRRKKRA